MKRLAIPFSLFVSLALIILLHTFHLLYGFTKTHAVI
jgi:hypothetical protein